MDAVYLQSTVGPLLSSAVTATLQRQPIDPVTFLAHFLLRHSTVDQERKDREKQLEEQMAEDERAHKQATTQHEQQQQSEQQKQQAVADHQQRLSSFLSSHTERDSVLSSFYPLLSSVLDVRSMYVARGEATESGGPVDALKFMSAKEGSEVVLTQRLTRPDGVLFDLLSEEEGGGQAEEEEVGGEEGEGGEVTTTNKVKEYRTLFIPNVLLGDKAARVKLFQRPQSGSLFAVRVDLQSVRSEETMEDVLDKLREREEKHKEEEEEKKKKEEEKEEAGEEEVKEEEEEEEIDEDDEEAVAARDQRRAEREAAKLIPVREETAEEKAEREEKERVAKAEKDEADLVAAVVKRTTPLLFCFDSLGQKRPIRDDERSTILSTLHSLHDAMVRLDTADFVQQREAYGAFVAWQKERLSSEGDKEGQEKEDEEKAEREKVKKDKKAAGQPHSLQDVDFTLATRHLVNLKSGLALLAQTEVLRGGCIESYSAAMLMCGMGRSQCGDWEGVAEWKDIRRCVNDDAWWMKVESYEPRADEDDSKWTTVKQWMAKIKAEDEGALKDKNAVSRAVVDWVKAALAVRARVRKERKEEKARIEREEREKREKEEEEERKRKEEEEAAAEAAEGEGGEEEEEQGDE